MEPFPPQSVLSDAPHDPWVSWARADAFLELKVRRSLAIGVLISILVHVLIALLLFLIFKHEISSGSDSAPLADRSLAVRLGPKSPPPAAAAPTPSPPTPEAKPVEKPRPQPRSKSVMTVTRPSPRSAPSSPALPAPPQPQTPDQPVDMMSMVTASRERRRQADEVAASENAAAEAANAEPTADQIALANIHRNLEKQARDSKGESGIFQIRSLGIRSAQFSFRGWTTDESNSTLQFIDVDAGPGGNVKLAVVQRMIELIRTHYTGDFNFESHRLGRVVVESARPEDNAKLEAFLMREFFNE